MLGVCPIPSAQAVIRVEEKPSFWQVKQAGATSGEGSMPGRAGNDRGVSQSQRVEDYLPLPGQTLGWLSKYFKRFPSTHL